jgi:hypothetical protein
MREPDRKRGFASVRRDGLALRKQVLNIPPDWAAGSSLRGWPKRFLVITEFTEPAIYDGLRSLAPGASRETELVALALANKGAAPRPWRTHE